MRSVVINRICLLLAFTGIFVAGYLSISHISGLSIPCGPSHDCDYVSQSAYGKFLNIPVAFFGLGAYLALALLGIARSFSKDAGVQRSTALAGVLIGAIGTVVSFYLTYAALFILHRTCYWCIGSAAVMALSFFTHSLLLQSLQGVETPDSSGGFDKVWIGLLAVLSIAGIGFRYTDVTKVGTPAMQGELTMNIEELVGKSPSLGSEHGDLIVIEFGDLACPTCKVAYHDMKSFLEHSKGKVQYVFKHLPLYMVPGHENSMQAAAVAEIAADHGQFWDFVDGMYGLGEGIEPSEADISAIEKLIALDPKEVSKRLSTPTDPIYDRIQTDMELAKKYKINATPTFIVGFRGDKAAIVSRTQLDKIMQGPRLAKLINGS